MIDINVVKDQLLETGENPYKKEPVDVQSNPDDYGNPYDDMICALKDMQISLNRIANYSEAERARPKLGMYPWTASATTGLSNVQNTTMRYRVQELVLTATGATTVSLFVGSSVQMTFVFSQADTKRFTYPVIFDRGVDVYLSGTGGITPTGFFTAYADE
jgi:hypothetical protein